MEDSRDESVIIYAKKGGNKQGRMKEFRYKRKYICCDRQEKRHEEKL